MSPHAVPPSTTNASLRKAVNTAPRNYPSGKHGGATSQVVTPAHSLDESKQSASSSSSAPSAKNEQAIRTYNAVSTFVSGVLAIITSQAMGAPLKLLEPRLFNEYMAWTKESFAILMTTITQWWAPTKVNVSGDQSMKDQLYQMPDGTLKCNFPHRLVIVANHQLYTDWLYLWWTAYANKMHGHIYIIMKESLRRLPIFGWAAQFYNFIFLSRNWETDKPRLRRALCGLSASTLPMWLLIFPEGTNLSAETRESSKAWSQKSKIPDMKHQLLPRTTGLRSCLSELRASTNWLYDCTIAYEGIPDGQYGQDIFTLKSCFFEGKPPKSVNMFWRRFRISEIPLDNEAAFNRWLTNRWREKDYILEYFYKYQRFPKNEPLVALRAVRGRALPEHAKSIETRIQAGGQDEFLGIFDSITVASRSLSSIDMTEPFDFDNLVSHILQPKPRTVCSRDYVNVKVKHGKPASSHKT